MIGVNPPGHYMWDPQTADEQIARYAKLCAQDDKCRERTDDLSASMRRTAADLPDRWFFLPIKDANVRIVLLDALRDDTEGGARNRTHLDRHVALRSRGRPERALVRLSIR
jgi:hypothetical protein